MLNGPILRIPRLCRIYQHGQFQALLRILPNKRACLNKRTPDLTFGYISKTDKLILFKFSAPNVKVHTHNFIEIGQEYRFSDSTPGAFIQRNTVCTIMLTMLTVGIFSYSLHI